MDEQFLMNISFEHSCAFDENMVDDESFSFSYGSKTCVQLWRIKLSPRKSRNFINFQKLYSTPPSITMTAMYFWQRTHVKCGSIRVPSRQTREFLLFSVFFLDKYAAKSVLARNSSLDPGENVRPETNWCSARQIDIYDQSLASLSKKALLLMIECGGSLWPHKFLDNCRTFYDQRWWIRVPTLKPRKTSPNVTFHSIWSMQGEETLPSWRDELQRKENLIKSIFRGYSGISPDLASRANTSPS